MVSGEVSGKVRCVAPPAFGSAVDTSSRGEPGKPSWGRETSLVEMPFTWGLDDFPAFEHVWTRNGVNPGLASPSQIYEIWAGDFDYLYERVGEGVYILTMHPQVIGRGHRLLMLERLVNHIRERNGISFKTMGEVALEFKESNPPKN